MTRELFYCIDWHRTVNLAERIKLLSTFSKKLNINNANDNFAQQKIKQWLSQPPFDKDDFFLKRLAKDNITKEEFICLLSNKKQVIENYLFEQPEWLKQFEKALLHLEVNKVQNCTSPKSKIKRVQHKFLYSIGFCLDQAFERLNYAIFFLTATHENLPFNSDLIGSTLVDHLLDQLTKILNRTMILELNVARLQGLLIGETQSERFCSFINYIRNYEVSLSIFKEYPVLARQLQISIEHWLDFSIEFLQNLCVDWEDIYKMFSLDNNLDKLVNLQIESGDNHRQGRSVIIARFESGFQLVYKPRNLNVDLHFQQLLTWVNQRNNHFQFRILEILTRDTHGWVEFVENKNCNNREELEYFYQQQGGYLALLYALEANDFHCDNLIAADKNPVLIDLETLFNPYKGSLDIAHSDMVAISQIIYSVLRVGLLPHKSWANEKSEGVDLSGLGASPGQLSPQGLPVVEGVGTDEMKVTRKQLEISVGKNRPIWNNNEINILDYTESIISGFTEIYCLLLEQRDRLLSFDSPLASFAKDEVRVLLRSTYVYDKMLSESFHPDLLRNALDRDRFFDRLWIDIEHRPELEKVVAAEQKDLWENDIPIFTTRPDSCDLWTSTNQQIPNFFTESGMSLVQKRLHQLSEQDMKRQIWFIRASLATLVIGVNQPKQDSVYHLNTSKTVICEREALTDRLIANACGLGKRLEELALCGGDEATWFGLDFINERDWSILPLDLDLYDGISGVLLFLSYLGAITQNNCYTVLAESALKTLQRQLKQTQSHSKIIGGFSGFGGIIYTLTHLGMLWNRPALLSEAEELVQALTPLIPDDKNFDIIAGAAGCIGGLISLYHCKPSQNTLAAAIQCGDHLIAKAQPMKQGIGWIITGHVEKALSGFSHGVAGIAWALIQLSALTGEKRFHQAAIEAINYERSLFCPDLRNWLDLRDYTKMNDRNNQDQQDQHHCMTAWCHGAPGIGLARLRMLPYLDNLAIRAEIDTAIKTTLEQGFGFNHSLCHGDLGNLELLLQASLIFKDPQLQIKVNHLTAVTLESIDKHGWLCGVPLNVETPGLMTGIAGIGYELLRLAAPERIPSVLVLEPPKVKSQA